VDDVHSLPTIAINSNERAFNIPATTPVVVNSHGSPVANVTVMLAALKQLGQTSGNKGVSRDDGVVEYDCQGCYRIQNVFAPSATFLVRFESYTHDFAGLACASNYIAGQVKNPITSVQWKVRPPTDGCVSGLPFTIRPEVTLLGEDGKPLTTLPPHHAVSFRLVDFPRWISTLPQFSSHGCFPAFSKDVDQTWCTSYFTDLLFDGTSSNSSGLNSRDSDNTWMGAADNNGNIRWPATISLKAGFPGSFTIAPVVDGIMGSPHTISCKSTVANNIDGTTGVFTPVVQTKELHLDVIRWPGVVTDAQGLLNGAIAPGELQLQQAFDPQPIIQVLDGDGRPVPGIRVQAIPSWNRKPGSRRHGGNDVDLMSMQKEPKASLSPKKEITSKTVCGTAWSAPSNATGHAVFEKLAVFQKRIARFNDPFSSNPNLYIHYQITRDPVSSTMPVYGCFRQSPNPPFEPVPADDSTNIWATPTGQSGAGPPGVKVIRWTIRTNPKVRWKGVQYVRRPSKEATFNTRIPVQPIVEVLPRDNSQFGGGYENSVQTKGWWVVPVVSVYPRPFTRRKDVVGCGNLELHGEMPNECAGVATKEDGRAYFENLNMYLMPNKLGFSQHQDNAGLYKIAFVAYPPYTPKSIRLQTVANTIDRLWGAKSEDTSFWAYINVKTIPQRIDIKQSPPSSVAVGEPFISSVKVKVGLANGAGLSGQVVTAKMVNTAIATTKENFNSQMLDPSRSTVFTDANGIATFRLIVDSAPPADYCLDFKTHDGLSSSATEGKIKVTNDVSNVTHK
jgi:hypothetical protein